MGDRGTQVAEAQRARLIAAVTEVVYEQGAREATVSVTVGRARISRRSFYEIFANAEECLLAAMQDALARARQRVLAAQEGVRGGWRAQTRAGLVALLAFFDESPQPAHLLVVESLVAGPRALELREQVLCELTRALQISEVCGEHEVHSPELIGEALIGAALAIVHRRMLHDAQRRRRRGGAAHRRGVKARAYAAGEPVPPVGRLSELAGPLMSMFVLPHRGMAAARRELGQAPISSSPTVAPDDAHVPVGIRLTNRTILVLSVIGRLGEEGRGPSNRQVALAAGIVDQGQASKLLARLCRQGLVQNLKGNRRELANVWRLTARGEAIVHSLRREAV